MKKVLILGGIFLHRKLVIAAHELGYQTIVIDNIPNSPAKSISDESYEINVTEIEKIVDLCKKENVSAVITGYIDFCQRYYQEICSRLNLPCYGTYEQFQILTNKEKFKAFCESHNVDTIPSYEPEDFSAESNTKIEYPVYVKPSYSRGSRGQSVCFNRDETTKAIQKASEISNDNKALIEKYLGKNDNFQVTYFVVNGTPHLLRTADQYQGSKELGLEKLCLAAVSPSKHTDFYIQNVHPRVIQMIQDLGIKNGPVFMQGFIDGDTIRFYDPGLRFPGTDYSIVLKKHMGIDTAKALIEFATTGHCQSIANQLNEKTVFLDGKAIVNIFPTLNPGEISFITNPKDILDITGVENISYRHSIGERINATGDVNQRIAEINLLVSSKQELICATEKIYRKLRVLDNQGHNLINNEFDPHQVQI